MAGAVKTEDRTPGSSLMNQTVRTAPMVSALVVLALLLAYPPGQAAAQNQAITVVSFGGSYARACDKAYHERFEAETGISIDLEDYTGGLAQIRAQVEMGNVFWDLVDLNMPELVRGCDEGLLVPVRIDDLPKGADGAYATDDFVEGTITECGVTKLFFSRIIAYNDERIGDLKPTTVADFFDLEKFPGRRGMKRSPVANLEFALMADGVPREDVYTTLDTEAGIARAFRKLDTIKEHVIWWETAAHPPQMLADGEVTMTTAANGRIFNAQELEGQPFIILWDSQILYTSGYGIVEGTRNLEAARRFLEFASTAQSMADLARYIAYSPTRRSAMPLVSTHAETGVDMKPHMPTAPENAARALHDDWEWWSDNGEEMNERFGTWLAR